MRSPALSRWPARATRGGLSSAGRASALQAEGHRFDPDRLHHGLDQQALCAVFARPIGRKLTSFREIQHQYRWFCRVWQDPGVRPQRRYCSKSSTLTKQWHSTNQGMSRVSMLLTLGRRPRDRSCSSWIKSSARRAFGGCLGSKRR